MKRNAWFALPVLAALAAAEPGTAQETLAARWRTVPADSAALAALVAETVEKGGEPALRAALAAVADASRPEDVRAHAVGAVFATAWDASPAGLLHRIVPVLERVGQGCERPDSWLAGDTLRVCGTTLMGTNPHGWEPDPSTTVGPALRDSALAVLRRVAREDPGVTVAGAADWVLSIVRDAASTPTPSRRADCTADPAAVRRRLREHPLRRDGRGPADTTRVYRLDEVDRPPALEDACHASRQVLRNYPPLLVIEGVTGTAVLSLVVGRDGTPRDIEVLETSHPDFVHARIGAARFRFIPATVGTTPVDVRITVPIHYRLNTYFPRRAESR